MVTQSGSFCMSKLSKNPFLKRFSPWVCWVFSLMSILVFTKHFEASSRVRGASKWAGKSFDFLIQNWDSHMTLLLKFLLQNHDLYTEFCSKIAKNNLIWANVGSLQSCLFYHLDTVLLIISFFPHDQITFRVFLFKIKSGPKCDFVSDLVSESDNIWNWVIFWNIGN